MLKSCEGEAGGCGLHGRGRVWGKRGGGVSGGGRGRGGPRSAGSEACRVFLLVRLQESRDFAPYEANEGAGEHLVGLPSGVLKVVVWVSQHVEKSLNQFFVLSRQEGKREGGWVEGGGEDRQREKTKL